MQPRTRMVSVVEGSQVPGIRSAASRAKEKAKMAYSEDLAQLRSFTRSKAQCFD